MSCKHDTHPHETRTIVVTADALEFACIFCEVESLRAQVASGAHCSGCGVKLGDSWCAKCATAAEVVRLRELIKRWKALGKRHGIGLRDAECVCTWEFGDSKCPAHPTCDECGCVVCECAIDAAGVGGK